MDEPTAKQIGTTWIVVGNGVASAGPTEERARQAYGDALRNHQFLAQWKAERTQVDHSLTDTMQEP